ncbi:MAG: nucleoside kinase [Tissierellia bacterium]|nr:nucleoside kinase [Tissierellia bacterium]
MKNNEFVAVRKIKLLDFVKENNIKNSIAAKVDNELVSLNTIVKKDQKFEIIDKYSKWGRKIYANTLSLVFILAVKEVFDNIRVNIEYTIGQGLYATIDNAHIDHNSIEKIDEKIKELIKRNITIEKEVVSYKVARSLFKAEGYEEKIELIDSLNKKEVEIYIVDGKVFTFDNILAPNTSFIDKFELINYYPGVIIQYPGSDGKISKFVEQAKIAKTFSVSRKWTETMNINFAGKLNEYVLNDQIDYLVKVNEAYYNNQLANCASKIASQDDLNIILIAGPSSSGKTTTASKLAIQLGVFGKKALVISTDDYFLDRDKTPIKENGVKDYENINAIDLEKLNKDLLCLLEGERITLPKYDFISGKSKREGETIKLDGRHPIIIEGIHSLNPKLSSQIPEKHKFKIYVSALTQINIDSHNRISTSNSRLIRRIVRDNNFRGNSCEETLKMWPDVREGENKYIFPYQENADFYMDTSLVYEFNALKKDAMENLKNIKKDSPYYLKAKELIDLLNNFVEMKNNFVIPTDSILREFLGGK